MNALQPQRDSKTVAIVGGGFAGSLFALKMVAARPDFRVLLIERQPRHGRGLAYGACAPYHLLNVPVSRMELGLNPGFAQWLCAKHTGALQDALAESGGDLASAFVSRELFGAYLQEQIADARSPDPTKGFALLRGDAVRALDAPARGVLLDDGREMETADEALVGAACGVPRR